MMHRMFFWRLWGGHMLWGLLGLLVAVGVVLLIVYLTSKKYKTPAVAKAASAASPAAVLSAAQERFLAILNERKAAGSMGDAEFEERRMVLDGGRSDNHANEDIVALKERYARGELTTSAYVKARYKLLGLG